MIDLLTITNQPELAARCDQLEGMRVFVDLERDGKAERQKGHNTFISTHHVDDVGRIKGVLKRSMLMVRVNPYQAANPAATVAEVDAVLSQGADLLMLPMFTKASELEAFGAIVGGRAPIVPLLETAGALHSIEEWVDTPGIHEVFVGLNDLHFSLGCRFMFEPLLDGHVDRIAAATRRRGLRMGFGGIARMNEGLLSGKDVLGEHLRINSSAVILSRTFNRSEGRHSFEDAVADLRQAEIRAGERTTAQIETDRLQVAEKIRAVVSDMKASA